jgi:hypothetical protein
MTYGFYLTMRALNLGKTVSLSVVLLAHLSDVAMALWRLKRCF